MPRPGVRAFQMAKGNNAKTLKGTQAWHANKKLNR